MADQDHTGQTTEETKTNDRNTTATTSVATVAKAATEAESVKKDDENNESIPENEVVYARIDSSTCQNNSLIVFHSTELKTPIPGSIFLIYYR